MKRNALVTGASEGLGFACARALLRSGHRVCILSRNQKKIESAANILAAEGYPDIMPVAGDLADPESLQKAIAGIGKNWGDIQILINSNGGPAAGKVTDLSDDAWLQAYHTFALPVFRAIREIVPQMKRQKWGRIITISSIAAREPIANLDLSNFIRGGFATLHKAMARDLAPYGINVHTLLPGAILTERTRNRIKDRATELGISPEESRKISEQKIPKGLLGDPSSVGEIAAFLCSDAAEYLTGCAIPVDGGMSVGI